MKYKITLLIFLIIYCGDNHIVERAASDYFPLQEDSYWLYSSGSDSIFVEVEPADTILQIECFPVSYNGAVRYIVKSDESISQYFLKIYNHAGTDYTVLEDFIVRIELPLVKGNDYHHVISDSIYVADQLISARYEIVGSVVDFAYESAYGDVYQIEITAIASMVTGDTSIADTSGVIEYYAPAIGMVRLSDATGEYELIEYNIP
ncbi:MAG: hypothetical protein JSV98_10300 [candidate division WOR-3 bacterium]|nr:MAG: hypothetical protein JSV98_10300 [candidate division WOR-3 bacterium]